ncbi:hypothetical protein MHTCC0001_29170 [Flavobacteriaceae bacterium MHTCC 0001]
MKKIILVFLFITGIISAQNYHYALDEASRTSDDEAPSAPENLVVNNITQTTADLSWDAATDNVGVVNYNIYNNGLLFRETIGNVTNFKLNDLSPETTYSITVRALDIANNESVDSNIANFTTVGYGPNMIEEEEYFDCYLLPLSQKDQLQEALNTYGCVRLEKGDYGRVSGRWINMETGMKLLGHPSQSAVPDINIGANGNGSDGIYINNISSHKINFIAGGIHRNNILKTIRRSSINTKGGNLEDNLFIDINGQILLDNSASGYYRNNRVYKHALSTLSPQLVLNGNDATPSYGNVHVWSNFLTPNGDAVILNNMGDFTFLGLDSEGWNIRQEQTVNAMFYAHDMGDLIITDFGGGNGYCADCETKPFDIKANNAFILNKGIGHEDSRQTNPQQPNTNASVFRANTNAFVAKSILKKSMYEIESGSTGTHAEVYHYGDEIGGHLNDVIKYNGNMITSALTGADSLSMVNQIMKPRRTPYPRPVFEDVPDPLGANWAADRIGQPDSHDYIQGLIDANKIAELPEGIYYIGSTLNVYGDVVQDNIQGIIGAGTGKTAIVGLTDDFPLITLRKNEPNFSLNVSQFWFANLTLQGGSTGIYSPDEIDQIAFISWKFLTFRNQENGIHLYHNYGFDNIFLDHVNFIDCKNAINQEVPLPVVWEDSAYIDKTVFYQCQFIGCETALQMTAGRANNLNTWINCKFDGNGLVGALGGNNYATFVNCDITNNTGGGISDELFNFASLSFYSCNFTGNSSSYIFNLNELFAEGCTFSDNIQLLSDLRHMNQSQYILNSTINGPLGGGSLSNKGMFINNRFAQDPLLNKLFVGMTPNTNGDNIITPIIDAQANPYPQFFVKH